VTAVSPCARCGTELPASILSCPACGGLVHSARLRELAASADALVAAGQLADARDAWQAALPLLPPQSQQHRQISERVDDLTRRIAADTTPRPRAKDASHPWWKRGAIGAVAVASLLLGKAKFLTLGILQAKTLFSMLAFAGVYWTAYGWPLAFGLAASIYIHEMGHVSMLRRYGIAADAPLFIPGVGAVVLLKQRISDPVVDARIGLEGPVWGLGAGIAAFVIATIMASPTWGAIAELTGLINLFNLTPVWQLDGSRGFHALSRPQRIAVVAAIALAFAATRQRLLLLVGIVALVRAAQKTTAAGDARTVATYIGLVAALAWLSRHVWN
jgi:Zn-dependent protease